MKTFIATFIFAASLAFTPFCVAEVKPLAKVIRSSGMVTVNGKQANEGTIVSPGESIVTDPKGSALLLLAAGQYFFVGNDTVASISELKFDGSGKRSSTVKVTKGSVSSDVHPPKVGSNQHAVVTAFGELKAKGTGWATSFVGSIETAVGYSGTVVGNFPGVTFDLTPGQVATVTINPTVVTIVDLTTGIVTLYRVGQSPEIRTATPSEMSAAAASFESMLPAFLATASEGDQMALGKVIAEINEKLRSLGLVAVGEGTSSLWPEALQNVLTQLSGISSPESPSTNQ